MQNYADLVRQIDIIERQIEWLEVDIDYWFGDNKFIPFTGKGAKRFGLSVASKNTDDLLQKLDKLRKMHEFYTTVKSDMDDSINALEGLEYKIAYRRFVQNKNYQEIADELGYSYGYIKNVASKAKDVTIT